MTISDPKISSSATVHASLTILLLHCRAVFQVRGDSRWWSSLAHWHLYCGRPDLLYGSKGASTLFNMSSGKMQMEYGGLPLSLSDRNPMSTLVRDQRYGQRTTKADLHRHHWSRRPRQGARIASSDFAKPVLMLVD